VVSSGDFVQLFLGRLLLGLVRGVGFFLAFLIIRRLAIPGSCRWSD
jgi:hypothetical protein